MRRALPLLLALVAFPVLPACDTETDDPVVFGGVELAARGDARLAVEGGQLVVSGLDGNRSGGFTLPGMPSRVDVEIAPLSVPAGGRFGAAVTGDGGLELASLFAEAGAGGRLDFRFTYPDLLDVRRAILRYKLNGRVVFSGEIDIVATRGRRATQSAGTGDGEPGSTHVVRSGGRYIIVADAENSGARRPGGCPGFLVTPPHPFDLEHPEPICTDWVEVEPVLQVPMPEGEVSVTARGVGRFVVRELVVSGRATAQ